MGRNAGKAVRIPDDLHGRISAAAEEAGETIADWVARAVESRLAGARASVSVPSGARAGGSERECGSEPDRLRQRVRSPESRPVGGYSLLSSPATSRRTGRDGPSGSLEPPSLAPLAAHANNGRAASHCPAEGGAGHRPARVDPRLQRPLGPRQAQTTPPADGEGDRLAAAQRAATAASEQLRQEAEEEAAVDSARARRAAREAEEEAAQAEAAHEAAWREEQEFVREADESVSAAAELQARTFASEQYEYEFILDRTLTRALAQGPEAGGGRHARAPHAQRANARREPRTAHGEPIRFGQHAQREHGLLKLKFGTSTFEL
jgi:hypothetical protein